MTSFPHAALDARMQDVLIGPEPDPCGAACADFVRGGGKRLRGALASAAARALGVPLSEATVWGVAVELLHNASLVHDDLQDGDRVRRGRPSLWALHGESMAVVAGDLLVAEATLALRELRAQARWPLAELLARAVADAARGQGLELRLLAEGRVDRPTWAMAVDGKSGALFALPVEGAALLAGASAPVTAQLAAPFRQIGTLYQVADDVLDLYAEGDEGGGGDIREGRVTALVVEHLERAPEDREWLLHVLRAPRDETGPEEVERVRRAFLASGALDGVLGRAEMHGAAVWNHPALADGALGELGRELVTRIEAPLRAMVRAA